MSNIEEAIRAANVEGRLALAAFMTGGFPDKDRFVEVMPKIAAAADVLEIGVPFSDPMADGVSIQRASEEAIKQGVTLRWILETVEATKPKCPIVLMSYLNPLLAFGTYDLGREAARVGVAGFIIPDLPYEEAEPFRAVFKDNDIDLIQLVTPTTSDHRLKTISEYSGGFVYAVTMTGTTGGNLSERQDVTEYLDRIRSVSPRPVMAGFGIRKPEHIGQLAGHTDGVIVGSAIMDLLRNGGNAEEFVQTLRAATHVKN